MMELFTEYTKEELEENVAGSDIAKYIVVKQVQTA